MRNLIWQRKLELCAKANSHVCKSQAIYKPKYDSRGRKTPAYLSRNYIFIDNAPFCAIWKTTDATANQSRIKLRSERLALLEYYEHTPRGYW